MKMFHREWKEIVEVVNFVGPQKGVQMAALVFSPSMLEKQNGNGWVLVKMSKLVPLEYMSTFTDSGYITKTLKNRIKERLQLIEAKWVSTDGIIYDNIDDAIEHEYKLTKQEDMVNLVKIPEEVNEEGLSFNV